MTMFQNPFKPKGGGTLAEQNAAAVEQTKSAFVKRADASLAAWKDIQDANYYLCLCFQNSGQADEFLTAIGLSLAERCIDGVEFCRAFGIELKTPVAKVIVTKTEQATQKLAMTLEEAQGHRK